jgi:leucyl aminopeptidase
MIERSPYQPEGPRILFLNTTEDATGKYINQATFEAVCRKHKDGVKVIPLLNETADAILLVVPFSKKKEESSEQRLERIRTLGHAAYKALMDMKYSSVQLLSDGCKSKYNYAFAEGFCLSNYKFTKYKKEGNGILHQIEIEENMLGDEQILSLKHTVQAVFFSRDLVNEPVSWLTAARLSEAALAMASEVGIEARTLSPEAIEALKMGGVLGVNKGSAAPPTFTILEWKPADAVNRQPLVLVGKGVVYDTGGYSIKPSSGMETMKCDMGGAAVVFGSIYAAALENVPLHIIGLVPAVENRVNEHAIVPGDIITISDGTTVEVMNTDAEGRLILADALVYAKQYHPALVMDFATLTGAAVRAIGNGGTVYMGTADKDIKKAVEKSGWATYERMVEFPLWDEYAEQLKSEIADLSNIGGPLAGASTAGKFLQHFTDYPWLHFDIAGPAFLSSASSYRPVGGTGTGVRFMIDFYKRYIEECLEEEKD